MENLNTLQLIPVEIDPDYRKKWNIHEQDFVSLCKNGNPVNNTLYRVGGFGVNLKAQYFMLIKHVEAFYSKDIMKMSKNTDPKHLESRWVIIDSEGREKVEFESFKSPYLLGGLIYSVDSNYYNIETGEFYCHASSSISSTDYLFIDNKYDEDHAKRGVVMINKHNGIHIILK